jgi:hypothetical protein
MKEHIRSANLLDKLEKIQLSCDGQLDVVDDFGRGCVNASYSNGNVVISFDNSFIKDKYITFVKDNRPNLEKIYNDIEVFGRPSAENSEEMLQYIFKIHEFLNKLLEDDPDAQLSTC